VIVGFIGSGKDGLINQLLGMEISIGLIAFACAVLLVVVTRADVEKLVKKVHWDTILFFIALFVLVGTLGDSGALEAIAETLLTLSGDPPNILLMLAIIMISAAILSALVDNIPVSAAFIPIIFDILKSSQIAESSLVWWVLLTAVSFGGGFTPVGSAPAVVAIGILKQEGWSITFVEFFKTLGLLSALMLVASFVYLVGFSYFIGI
ncbi:MAG: SLC13 family permease, partial [Candidatus Hodarchaeales archaeon]